MPLGAKVQFMRLPPLSRIPMPLFLYALLPLLASGCSGAPSFAIAGSYFPAWLVFSFTSILLTLLIRVVFIRLGIDDVLRFRLFVYVCIALSLCFISLLLFAAR